MSKAAPAAAAVLTAGERYDIHRELDPFFPTLPRVADGLQLRTWRGGPHAGQPRVPFAAQGLLDRGLVRLEPTPWPLRLFFTDAGLSALRAMMADGRQAHPKTFAHVRRELGIDPAQDQDPVAEPLGAGLVAQSSGAAAFPPPAGWDNSSVSTERPCRGRVRTGCLRHASSNLRWIGG